MTSTHFSARPLRSRWPWWRRAIREPIWAFDADGGTGDGSPSATKIAGYVLLFLAAYAVVRGKPISVTQLAMAIAGVSALFGRSIWRTYLRTQAVRASVEEKVERKEVTREEVARRRDPAAGVEPAPRAP